MNVTRPTLILCAVLISGCTLGDLFWPSGKPVTPDTPDTPVVVVPAELTAQIDTAFGPAGNEDARRFAALYAVAAEEVKTTAKPCMQFNRSVAAARDSLGMAKYPAMADIMRARLDRYSQTTQWTDEIRSSWSKDLSEISVACKEASGR